MGYRSKYERIVAFNLRRLKKEAGSTYKEIAMAVGRAPGTVQQWAAEGSNPDFAVLVVMADFFSRKLGRFVPLDEFFDRKPAEKPSV